MDHYRETGQVDPDYESYNSALELNEEEEQKENYNKLKKIIEEEYNREIALRRDQVEKIELQICKTRKLLHLVRYALIMSYYKKKELEYSGNEEETASDSLIVPDKQNRIHPAIKKLLGKNVNNFDHITIKDKRKSNSRNVVSRKVGESLSIPESKKIKLDVFVPQTVEKTVVQSPNTDNKTSPEFSRSRKKTKYRIVVGNISKWMPSAEDVLLTHKWMVYVRGPKEKPDVSHFIDKVVYHLHPSYKPHDVVEVSESPFHLSRRGWGEFPVRVQIFFKETLNKPIDVVHNIKLDKTYSGRQTLGNETIVDVFLYNQKSLATSSREDEINQQINENFEEIDVQNIKIEEDGSIEECNLSEMDTANVEHDYCSGNVQEGTTEDNSEKEYFEHSYSLPPSHEGLPKPKKEKIEQDESNKLIYGLDLYCRGENEEPERSTNKTIIPANYIKQLIQLNRKDIKFNNTKIIVLGKKVEGSFLANFGKLTSRDVVSTNRVEANSIKVTLPKNRFKNMGEVLSYLFKKLPLYSELANNANYKRIYPFTASSLKEYASWNVGKKRSSEWSRARAIKKILVTEKFPGTENWTTKAILMYGRSHEYTPFVSNALFVRDSEEKKLLMNSYSNSCNIVKSHLYKNNMRDEQDVTVNVDSDTTSPKKTKPLIDISDPTTNLECSFIRQNALDVGVILKPEEIIEGVKVNGAEMVILEAVKCLADNLIRKARNYRVCTKPLSSNTSAINLEDVEAAVNERSEFFHIQQFRIERNEYFS